MVADSSLPPPVSFRIAGTDIATYQLGPAKGSAGDVVLCHGTPWSAHSWSLIARELAKDYRVFLWDMPGYGASINERDVPVDLVHQRQRLRAAIEEWALDRPHVVAHDIGGAVALGAHLFEGLEIESLYLLDIVTLDPWGSPFFRLVARHEDVFSALPPKLHAALVREYISGAAGRSLDPAWIDQLAGPWCTPIGQRAFYRQIAQLSPEHTRGIVERLGDVRCRVRIGWGVEDPWIPVAQSGDLASRLPHGAEVALFEGAGHLVLLESPDELGADIHSWLNGSLREQHSAHGH